MMDRIYRGKTKNGEWGYGSYLRTDSLYDGARGLHRDWIIESAGQSGGMVCLRKKFAVLPETVGQYIGIEDKNEKPIFEDDIVKQIVQYPDSEPKVLIGVVKEDFCNPCFVIDDGKYPEFDFIKCGYATLEVLGNVHDNPELIGGDC